MILTGLACFSPSRRLLSKTEHVHGHIGEKISLFIRHFAADDGDRPAAADQDAFRIDRSFRYIPDKVYMGALGHIFSSVGSGREACYHICQRIEHSAMDHAHQVCHAMGDLHADLTAFRGDLFNLHIGISHKWIVFYILVRVEDVPCFFHDFSSFCVPAVSIIPSTLLIWNRFLPATVKVPHRYKRCIFPDRILPYRQSSCKPPRCDLIPRCDLVHIRYTFWNDTAPGLNRYKSLSILRETASAVSSFNLSFVRDWVPEVQPFSDLQVIH